MGQKINPIGLRLGINRTWDSRWFAGRRYGERLHEDLRLRKYLTTRLSAAGVSKVVVDESVIEHRTEPYLIYQTQPAAPKVASAE